MFKKVPESESILAALNLKLNGLRTLDALRPLIAFVNKSQCLKVLDLSLNLLTNETASILANCLRKNHHLLEIDLSGNLFDANSTENLLRHLLQFRATGDLSRTVLLKNCYVNAAFETILKRIDQQQPEPNRYEIEGVLLSKMATVRTPSAQELKTVLLKRLRFLSKPKSTKKIAESKFAKIFTKIEQKLRSKSGKNQDLPVQVSLDRAEFDTILAKSKVAARWKLDSVLIDQVFDEWPSSTNPKSLNLTGFLNDFRSLCDI